MRAALPFDFMNAINKLSLPLCVLSHPNRMYPPCVGTMHDYLILFFFFAQDGARPPRSTFNLSTFEKESRDYFPQGELDGV